MVLSTEQKKINRREAQRKYREKNKEKIAEMREKDKEYYISYAKNYRNVNKELLYEKRKKYGETETGKKLIHISLWKRRNVKLRENETYDDLYNIYLNTTNCKDCNVLLVVGKRCKETKCLDHDHNTGYFRDIVCHSCNCKRH